MVLLAQYVPFVPFREGNEHTSHDLQGVSRGISVSTGSQESFCRAVEMLVEPTDCILVDNPCYSGALAFLRPYGCKIVGVDADKDGLIPAALDHILSGWDGGMPRPRVLYTNPTAQNPSGSTLSKKVGTTPLATMQLQ
jgi:DNA-binding transcriptional MocR family regulator